MLQMFKSIFSSKAEESKMIELQPCTKDDLNLIECLLQKTVLLTTIGIISEELSTRYWTLGMIQLKIGFINDRVRWAITNIHTDMDLHIVRVSEILSTELEGCKAKGCLACHQIIAALQELTNTRMPMDRQEFKTFLMEINDNPNLYGSEKPITIQ
jgi:hypothetical protein